MTCTAAAFQRSPNAIVCSSLPPVQHACQPSQEPLDAEDVMQLQ